MNLQVKKYAFLKNVQIFSGPPESKKILAKNKQNHSLFGQKMYSISKE